NPLGVLPRAASDAITRVDGGLTAGGAGTEVSVPSAVADPDLLRQRLALSIGARQAAQVRSLSGADAGDEKRHVCRLLLQAGARTQRQQRYYHDQGKTRGVLHSSPPVPSLRSRWAVAPFVSAA